MAESRGHAGACGLRERAERLQHAVLEVHGAAVRQFRECMPRHVEDAELELPDLGICGVEVPSLHDTLHKGLGNGFPRPVMPGKGAEPLRLEGPVLHYLAREFHEIVVHVGTGQRAVASLGKDTVQGMSELVKECGQLVVRQQRRRLRRGLGEIGDYADEGTLLDSVDDALPAELRHPRAAPLPSAH